MTRCLKGWATRDLSRRKENIFGRNLSNNIFEPKTFHVPELSVYPLDGGEVGAGVRGGGGLVQLHGGGEGGHEAGHLAGQLRGVARGAAAGAAGVSRAETGPGTMLAQEPGVRAVDMQPMLNISVILR